MRARIFLAALGAAGLGLTAPSALANCEAGAFLIHTTATYKPFDPVRTFVLYRERDGALEARLGGVDLENHESNVAERFRGNFLLIQGGFSCPVDVGAAGDPAALEMGGYPYRLGLGACEALLLEAGEVGYARVDLVDRQVRLSRALSIAKDAPPSAALRERAERQALAELQTLDLHLERQVSSDAAPATALRLDERGDARFRYTRIGDETWLAVAELRIERTLEDWGPIGEPLREELGVEARVGIDFPTLFLVDPRNGARFIGDGSWCANHSIFEADAAPSEGAALGSLRSWQGETTFEPTHASDFDGDGRVDVLEVNSRFAYEIGPGGGLRVISYGMGC